MTESVHRVFVNILDKEYQVACQPEEKDALMAAAKELDQRMRKVRNSGAIIGVDRIAVMVALNLCHELHQQQAEQRHKTPSEPQLSQLLQKLDDALKPE